MQSGRLISALLKRCEPVTACDQCWALIKAASSSTWPTAAVATPAATAAVPQWSTLGQLQAFSTSVLQQAAGATATAAQAAAGGQEAAATQLADTPQQQQQQAQKKTQRPSKQQAAKVSFEDLQEQYQQQLSLRNVRDEENLLVLFNHAHKPDQVQTALDLLRWDKMVRARQQMRYKHFSPKAIRMLLKVGRRAQLGPQFAVKLLEEADELGMQVSLTACEDVLDHCISKQDYWAAAEAWVYTRLYCADPSRNQPEADESGSHAASPQQQQREGPLGWASNSLLRLYAKGLAEWLQQGCVSKGHERYVKQQLEQIVGEMAARGAAVPDKVQQALEAPSAFAAPAADSQPDNQTEGAAEAAADSQPEPKPTS